MAAPVVEVYAKKKCCLCDEAKKVIGRVRDEIPFHMKEVDISSSAELARRYDGHVPTVFINGKKAFKFKVDEVEFKKRVRKEIIKSGISKAAAKSDALR